MSEAPTTDLANDMLAAVKMHFPEAELVGLVASTLACCNCMRPATSGLSLKHKPICTVCAPYSLGILQMRGAPNTIENEALKAGGQTGGAYLDSIGKYDLAVLSGEEWAEFLRRVLEGYAEHMRELARDWPPF